MFDAQPDGLSSPLAFVSSTFALFLSFFSLLFSLCALKNYSNFSPLYRDEIVAFWA
jgi:hypothetical protein